MSVEILAHRGYWLNKQEMNTMDAFQRAIDHGFGIETDFRDRNNELVIAHDYNEPSYLKAEDLFERIKVNTVTLAINVKSSGLEHLLSKNLNQLDIQKYFIFDLSIPDYFRYKMSGLNLYTRLSEYESMGKLDQTALGYWIDQFYSQWFDTELIEQIANTKKKMCFVSPELHGRDPYVLWQLIKYLQQKLEANSIQICTDLPAQLKSFLNE